MTEPLTAYTTDTTTPTIGTADDYTFEPSPENVLKTIRATIGMLKMLGKLAGVEIDVTIRGAKE